MGGLTIISTIGTTATSSSILATKTSVLDRRRIFLVADAAAAAAPATASCVRVILFYIVYYCGFRSSLLSLLPNKMQRECSIRYRGISLMRCGDMPMADFD